MRNYVIINGVNSLTIQGLAIKTLPPITKPIQRNLREEIDGRDGDIVTTLGYGAYDKTIEIGLFGTFDIDEVIAYFNQKGTITFSNEADKVYYFEALDQVDYAELLKFRTANVVLHCQPFKYPLNETPLEEEYEYVEATGTNVTLDNTSEAIFNKIDLKGNTSQDGTPTPDNPVDINVVSGDNTINVCGKNLANLPTDTSLPLSNATTIIDFGEDRTFSSITTSFILNNAKYTNPSGAIINYQKADGTNQYRIAGAFGMRSNTNLSGTYSLTIDNLTFSKVLVRDWLLMTQGTMSVQIEKGSTATTYEPYTGASYPINLGNIELCKIGDYQDYIYKDNGKWWLYKAIGKVVLDGSENWVLNNTGTDNWFYSCSGITDANMTENIRNQTLSNRYQYAQIFTTNTNQGLWYSSTNIRIRYGTEDTIANYKSWLTSNNVSIYYPLATPTTTEITDTTLISQLEELKNATSYESQTNISQTNNDMPFILDLLALKENSDHLVIDNIGNIYSKPTLDLEGTGIVDIYLNDSQMFEVNLSEKNEIVIDTEKMEAYNPTDNTLANRQVTGDYSKFKLDSGENDLRFSGDLTKATITNYERWL